jgi:hypothetical protein
MKPGQQFALGIGIYFIICVMIVVLILGMYQQTYKKRTNAALEELEKIKL